MGLNLKRVVEALIFAADEPVTLERIAAVCTAVTGDPPPDRDELLLAVERLNEHYQTSGSSFRIYAWAGGYRMATEPSLAPFVRELFQERQVRRLSRSALETLSIVAYRQPVTKPEIDFIRGVDSGHAIRRLMDTGFVDVVGRSDAVGRPLLYGTTPHFLEQFGLDSLQSLPKPREIEELLSEPAFDKERSRLMMIEGLGGLHGEKTTDTA